MAQKLIVEGKDAIFLSALMQVKGLPKPLGYTDETKYRKSFVVDAGGYDKALLAFEEELANTSLSNVGIIVDANTAGAQSRWEAIRHRLIGIFSQPELNGAKMSAEGIVLTKGDLTVGVWVMPDNASNGYLEHFVTGMINDETGLWSYTQQAVDELYSKPFFKASQMEVKKQKVLAHTWLAWQSSPGLPFGSALQAGFFDAAAAVALPFLNWFEKTFQLEKPV